MNFVSAAVRGFARDLFSVLLQGTSHARPSAATISIGLIEYGNAFSVDANKIIHETGGFLAVGSAQIKGEVAIRRFSLGLRAGEWKEQEDVSVLKFFEHRKHAGYGGRSDITEEQKYIVFQHQFQGIFDRGIGLIAVVIGFENDFAPRDTPLLIDVCEIRTGTAIQFDAQTPGRAGERCGYAEDNLGVGHAR